MNINDCVCLSCHKVRPSLLKCVNCEKPILCYNCRNTAKAKNPKDTYNYCDNCKIIKYHCVGCNNELDPPCHSWNSSNNKWILKKCSKCYFNGQQTLSAGTTCSL